MAPKPETIRAVAPLLRLMVKEHRERVAAVRPATAPAPVRRELERRSA